ncbi:MAG TPA: LysE family translocator [Nevskia sp.]|nr:LysE family translocator [Nevskia sp.]
MPSAAHWVTFALVALGMVLTPGPNMIYLISRTLCQGRAAGLLSLIGVAGGFIFYMLCAAFGITALVMAVPYAYDSLRLAGAAYLLYLAWQALRPGGRSPFSIPAAQPPTDVPLPHSGRGEGQSRSDWRGEGSPRFVGAGELRELPPDSPRRLVAMGLFTNLLNPKAAVLYLSLLPQFADPAQGPVLPQLLTLGCTQMAISISVNGLIVLSAAGIARFLLQRPGWRLAQRWMMGSVLGMLAVRMAVEQRR